MILAWVQAPFRWYTGTPLTKRHPICIAQRNESYRFKALFILFKSILLRSHLNLISLSYLSFQFLLRNTLRKKKFHCSDDLPNTLNLERKVQDRPLLRNFKIFMSRMYFFYYLFIHNKSKSTSRSRNLSPLANKWNSPPSKLHNFYIVDDISDLSESYTE